MSEENIGWDEALAGGGKFVTLKPDEAKEIVITNWRFERNPKDAKIAPDLIALRADVVEEDGVTCEKTLDTTSNRLKSKLRPILENKATSDKVRVSIFTVGEKYDRQYSAKEVIVKKA